MLKREDPFTPQPQRIKKTKDYVSPVVKTPLRNMLSAENVANAEPIPPIVDTQRHQQQRRKRALLSRKRSEADLLSPAPGISPKAAPLSIHSPLNVAHSSKLRHSPSTISTTLNNQKLSIEQMTRSFDEWMRIAADNKINAKNTWNFALIDYFSELTFLRDEDDEKAINFQKASCTLDGCVKIYSSRVDAVMDEAGKLLSGLNERSGTKGTDDSEGEEEAGQSTKRATRKHSRPAGETLEKNLENLSVKGKLEMQGDTIDPLFKKTCADFDEATGGSLLFNLMVDQQCKVVFDSNQPLDDRLSNDSCTDVLFDASSIINTFGFSLSSLHDLSLTQTLDSYSFLQSSDGFNNVHDRLAASLEKLSVEPNHTSGYMNEENPFDSHQQATDNPPQDEFYFLDEGKLGYEEDRDERILEEQSFEQLALQFSAMGTAAGPSFEFLEEPGRMKTTWAGVEHWKIKRVTSSSSSNKSRIAVAHAPRTKKLINVDFTSTDVDLENLLAKGSNLTVMRSDNLVEATTLPDDLHISSSQFTRLFIKPTWRFSQVRTTRVAERGEHVEFVEQPNPAMQQKIVEEPTLPFDDDADYGAADYNLVDLSQSLVALQPTQAPLTVNYARRAKRIDVHLLKDCIWRTVESSKENTKLSQVIHSLPSQYTETNHGDLSVQYAFICLLHLANENGLTITEQSDGDLCIASN